MLTENLTSKDFNKREEGLQNVCNLIVSDAMPSEAKLLILDYSFQVIFQTVGSKDQNYVRSTTLSVIDCILEDNYSKNYIESTKLEEIYTAMLEYITLEDVENGFDEQYGLIHTLAHIADIFTTFFMYKNFCTLDRFKTYFELITDKYCSNNYIFVTDEAARIFRIFNYFFLDSFSSEYVIDFLLEYKNSLGKGLDGLMQKQNYYTYLHTLAYFNNDMEVLRFINEQLENKYRRYMNV